MKYLLIAALVLCAVGCKKEGAAEVDADAAVVDAAESVDIAQEATAAADVTVTVATDATATN